MARLFTLFEQYVTQTEHINNKSQYHRRLTPIHLPMNKMAAISQTIFSNAFLWMKILYFD